MNSLLNKFSENLTATTDDNATLIENATSSYLDDEGTLKAHDLFADLENDTDRTYEKYLVAIARSQVNVDKLTEKLERDFLDSELDKNTRYALFYCLNQVYRLYKDFKKSQELFKEYADEFDRYPSYSHLKLLLDLNQISVLTNEEIEELLTIARDDARRYSSNSGYVHLFADFVATVFEEGRGDVVSRELWLKDAIESAHLCCEWLAPEYPKFHATYGRLLALRGNEETNDFLKARQEIREAIALEPSCEKDYAIRVGQYQVDLMKVQAAEQRKEAEAINERYDKRVAEFEKKLDKGLEEINDSKISNLEFIGFFAALISFTIGSLSIVQAFSPMDAAKLIIILAGALLLAFGGFAVIVCRNTRGIFSRVVPIVALGLIVIVAGFSIFPN